MNNLVKKELILRSKISNHLFQSVYHSKSYCPAFRSRKEWKFTLLHLESKLPTLDI